MKKRYIFSFLLAGATFITSCTKNFEEVNTHPDKTTGELINPNYFLSQAQLTGSQTGYDQLLYQSMWMQSLASTFSYYSNGDKYVYGGAGPGYFSYPWNRMYSALTLVDEMKALVKDKPEYVNLNAAGTIYRMMLIQRLTDLYGDIPYTEEGQAKSGNFTPKFDKQQDIYADMLKQLEAATAALDPSKTGPTTDLFYGGDVNKWKRLGYSVMLKVAMRLTKVDANTARSWAEKAYAGGTMNSVADNAKVFADASNSTNSNSDALRVSDDFREVRWGKTLIDYLKTTNDPRISAIAEIAPAGAKGNANLETTGDNTASIQVGMPNGYTTSTIASAPGYPGASTAAGDSPAPLGKYSRPRVAVYEDKGSANFLYTYGESELFLAEAASRGWNTGVAATHYANALAADMRSLAGYNTSAAATVNEANITAYVAAHPLLPATALEQINMEYWVVTSSLFNFNETFANWRRSGYPALTPVTYSGQYITGQIPRRMPYPTSLIQTNGANYASAVQAQGPDNFATRVWWDK